MTMLIGAIDAEDQLAEAMLDGKTFYVGRSWNVTGAFWTFSIRSADDVTLLTGQMMTPNSLLLRRHRAPGLPPGELFAWYGGTEDRIGRNDFTNGNAALLYATQAESAEAGGDAYNGSI